MKDAKLYEQNNDKDRNYAITLNKIGLTYYDLKEYDNALIHFQKSLDILKSINQEESASAAAALNNIGVVYK